MGVLRQRLAEELEDEREQHQKDLSERDFTIDQTRKKYQGMLSVTLENILSLKQSFCSGTSTIKRRYGTACFCSQITVDTDN